MKIFTLLDKISEIIGWLQIFLSLTAFGTIIGAITYYFFQTTAGLVVGICFALLGLISGIRIATKMWRTKGTVWLVSRVSASTELDNLEERADVLK